MKSERAKARPRAPADPYRALFEALDDGNSQLQRGQLGRRGPETSPPSGCSVRLRQAERDLVVLRQVLEHARAERGAGGEADAHR